MSADAIDIDHPSEIAALLEELAADQGLLQLEAPGGEILALSALRLDRDSGLLWLRLPGLSAEPPSWLLHGSVHAHALLDRVRIDFDLGRRDLASDGGLPALRLAVPLRMRRHQRRQDFRVPSLSQHHPRALLAHAEAALRLPALDLSAGGVALVWPAGLTLPVPGELLGPLELELERELRIAVQLRVCHQRRREDGSAVLGCAFEALTPMAERALQQQMVLLQRRHRVIGR